MTTMTAWGGGFYQSAGMVNRCFIPGDSNCSSLDVSTRNPGHCASVARSAYGMRMRMRSKRVVVARTIVKVKSYHICCPTCI